MRDAGGFLRLKETPVTTPPVETAEPGADTAVTEPQSSEQQPETTESAPTPLLGQPATETVVPAETETPEATEPDPPSLADQIAALSDEEVAELAPVKSLVARRTESASQQTAHRVATARQQAVQSGQAHAKIQNLARDAAANVDADGNVTIDPKAFSDEIDQVIYTAMDLTRSTALNQIIAEVPEGFATADEVRAFQNAAGVVAADPTNPGPVIDVALRVLNRHIVAESRASIEKEVRAELQKEFDAKGTNKDSKTAQATRKATTDATPTTGGATPPGSYSTQLGWESAHARGEVSTAQIKAAQASPTWDETPYR